MDSNDSTLTLAQRMMPVTAILRHELRALRKSWIVRLWLVLAALVSFLVTTSSWAHVPSATLVGYLLLPFLFLPWFLVVMMLGINPVTGARSESLADGMLCRPITRSQFLIGSWSARVTLVLGVFLLTTAPFILCVVFADRPLIDAEAAAIAAAKAKSTQASPDKIMAASIAAGKAAAAANPLNTITLWGTAFSVGLVALVLIFQVSLAFMLGTLLRNPLGTIFVLLLIWCPLNLILAQFKLEEFSTVSLSEAIPTLAMRQAPWVDEPEPREVEEAVVEEEEEEEESPSLVSGFLNAITTGSIGSTGSTGSPRTDPFGNPVKGPEVEEKGPEVEEEKQEYEDFSLPWVLTIYSMLSAGSLGVAMFRFSRGDL